MSQIFKNLIQNLQNRYVYLLWFVTVEFIFIMYAWVPISASTNNGLLIFIKESLLSPLWRFPPGRYIIYAAGTLCFYVISYYILNSNKYSQTFCFDFLHEIRCGENIRKTMITFRLSFIFLIFLSGVLILLFFFVSLRLEPYISFELLSIVFLGIFLVILLLNIILPSLHTTYKWIVWFNAIFTINKLFFRNIHILFLLIISLILIALTIIIPLIITYIGYSMSKYPLTFKIISQFTRFIFYIWTIVSVTTIYKHIIDTHLKHNTDKSDSKPLVWY